MPILPGTRVARVAAFLALAPLAAAGCQTPGRSPADAQADQQMSQALDPGPHMTLTQMRPATHTDSARAAAVAHTLRRAIARYADVRVAEAEGFRPFAPNAKGQKVLHYTRYASAARAAFAFDPAKPTSLLYRRQPDGSLKLIGAMYSAPRRASLAELDRRVPLSIARWHLHTNLCIPPRGRRERWSEMRNGKPVFGPFSPVATREACDKVGGRFLPSLFGWMVHANVLEGDDPAVVWGMAHDGMSHGGMAGGHGSES
jgi:hypothetical protein